MTQCGMRRSFTALTSVFVPLTALLTSRFSRLAVTTAEGALVVAAGSEPDDVIVARTLELAGRNAIVDQRP
jgi:hypothetical protein